MIELVDETPKRTVTWELYLKHYVDRYPHFLYGGEICLHHTEHTVSWLNTGVTFNIEKYASVIPIDLTVCKFKIAKEHL